MENLNYTYDINGKTYTQTHLTAGRYFKLIHLIRSEEINTLDPIGLLAALEDAGKCNQVFEDIIFAGQGLKYEDIMPAVATRVVMDFFALNKASEIARELSRGNLMPPEARELFEQGIQAIAKAQMMQQQAFAEN